MAEDIHEIDVTEKSPVLLGRRKIFTSVSEITPDNVMDVLNSALTEHFRNLSEEEYLYWYRRGMQPILYRHKEIRPEILNKVLINNAAMVTTFKNGYFLTKPVSYVSRSEESGIVEKVKQLNEYVYASGKNHADNEVVDNFHTMGLGALYVEPNRENRPRKPVNVYSLDPKSAFCVYSLMPGNDPVMGVYMVISGDTIFYDVYTHDTVYHLTGAAYAQNVGNENDYKMSGIASKLGSYEPNRVGEIPIIEYQYNSNRMSAFECAIPIMDAINTIESNRCDGVEQAIQQLCIAYNCQFEEGTTANSIRQAGMICLRSVGDNKADFKILDSTLNQSDTQTTIDSLYEQMLEKCGVPSSVRDGGSTSDNVGAVYLRSGWAAADTDARNTEDLFRASNARFTKVFLKILDQKGLLNGLEPEDFDLVFIRNDQNNLLAKTQAAINMKLLGFSPEIAFERSGLSNDPVQDVARSKRYIDMMWTEQNKPMQNQSDDVEANIRDSAQKAGNLVPGNGGEQQ